MQQYVLLRNINCQGKGAVLKKLLVLTVSIFTVSACQSIDVTQSAANSNVQYLDLSEPAKKSLFENYWQVKYRKEPRYPRAAALNGISGCTELAVGINTEGKVSHYKVIKSYPAGVFDQNAIEAILAWRYTPTATNQNLQPVLTTLQLDFMVSEVGNLAEAKAICTKTNTSAVGSGV